MYATWFSYRSVTINETKTETLSYTEAGETGLSLMSSPVENETNKIHIIHPTGVNYRIISGSKLIGASPSWSHYARPALFTADS